MTIKERSIQRAALYVADELFFSGTAAEITPIRSVDRISIGSGGRGEITERIQKVFFEITKGERPAPGPWLTYVREQVQAPEPATPLTKGADYDSTDVPPARVAKSPVPEFVASAHASK